MCWGDTHTRTWGSSSSTPSEPPHQGCDCGLLTADDFDVVSRLKAHNAALQAVVEAAGILKQRWDALCDCVNEFEPEDMTACGERRDDLDRAILDVIAARDATLGKEGVG